MTGTPATQPVTFRGRADVDAYLDRLTRFGIKLGLDTITDLLAALGDPQRRYPSIHIAGTNGKGSTAAFLDALLSGFGQCTGRYTSPHLEDFRERICVAGEPISDADLVRVAERVARVAPTSPPPTFFEATTAMALEHFACLPAGKSADQPTNGTQPGKAADVAVDVAVVETGLGGRLDATNVLTPRVCVITGVALEHTEHLGPDIASIAAEKAGIIKPGVPVVTAATGVALDVIRRRAAEVGAPLYVHGHAHGADFGLMGDECSLHWCGIRTNYTGLTLGLAGAHQRANAALALAAAELFLPAGVSMAEEAVRAALLHTRWPGRLETVCDDPPLLLDAAHNPEAAHALAAFLADWRRDGKPLWLVLGVLADKDFEALFTPLAEHASRVVLTVPDTPRRGDLSAQEKVVHAVCRAVTGATGATVIPKVSDAVHHAVAAARAAGGRVCVTGSIYTLGEARAALRRAGIIPWTP